MNLIFSNYCVRFAIIIESSSPSGKEEHAYSPGQITSHGTNVRTLLDKTHVPIFRGMVVTHRLLNKADFVIKQDVACVASFSLQLSVPSEITPVG